MTQPSAKKIWLDLAPLICFWLGYTLGGLKIATLALIVSLILACVLHRVWLKVKPPTLMLVVTVLAVGLGGMTLITDNGVWIKMKPTLVNVAFALALLVGLALGKLPLKSLLGQSIPWVQNPTWRILTWRWIVFFLSMALLNEVFWRFGSEWLWVQFKVFGIFALTLLFMALQWPLLKPSIEQEQSIDSKNQHE